MNRIINFNKTIWILALFITFGLFSCKDYLNDPSVTEDPNRATEVTPGAGYQW